MQKFNFFLFILFFFLSPIVWGQNEVTDSTTTIIGYWEKGDKVRFAFTQATEKYRNGVIYAKNSSNCFIDLTILEATETSYTINWKYSDIKLKEQDSNPLLPKLIKLTEGLDIQYKTDEMGAFKELLNWQEVRTFVSNLLDKMRNEAKVKQIEPELEQMKKIFSTKESMEEVIIKDIQVFHSLYGGMYKLKEKLSVDTQLPNILGGEPFPATLSVEMTSLKPEENYCKITINQTVDKVKSTKIINDWLIKINPDKAKNAKMPNISVDDFNIYEFDLKSGWITYLINKRTGIADNEKKVESIEFKKL
jgi:hypothetical protein